MLCLLPFEKRFYENRGVAAEFVGHPLADAIPADRRSRRGARAALNVAADAQVVALLPGSRRGEVARLARISPRTARWLARQRPSLQFIAPMATSATREIFEHALRQQAPRGSPCA